MEEILKKAINEAIREVSGSSGFTSISSEEIEHPADLEYGDFAFTGTMKTFASVRASVKRLIDDKNALGTIGGSLGSSPVEFAKKIVAELEKKGIEGIEKVEIAGPGFINFYLDRAFFTDAVKKVDEHFGRNENLKGKKIIVEYTDPNPFKEFHIGHLMSNAIGEVFARILEYSGAKVSRANYQGDVGLHVAKTIWAMQKNNVEPENVALDAIGFMYSVGTKAYEEDPKAKGEIEELNKKIYEKDSEIIERYYKPGRDISLKQFEKMYDVLGTKFDEYFFESESGELGKQLVEKHTGSVFEKSEGAIIFKGEEHGLHTRVFINSMGLPTYEAKELALASIKYDRFKYDTSIVITANEQNAHFDVGLKALEFVYPELAEKTRHVSHGLLKLPSGKMSSRTGTIVPAVKLIDDVKVRALEKMHEKDETIAEQIAISAIKFSILKQAPGRDVIFDMEQSVSFEGDSGPYLQYTYVRTKSLLEKAQAEGVKPKVKDAPEGVTTVEKLLYRFPEVIERAARDYAPQLVTHYLLELAGAFNSFYAQEKIVDAQDQHSPYKLALTEAVGVTLKNGLWVLGIEVPERM